MTIKASIIAATGYVGIELVRLLQQHPQVTLESLVTESYAGEAIAKVYPHLDKIITQLGEKLDIDTVCEKSDLIFLALPHGKAIPLIEAFLAKGKKVIDLSSDVRLKDPNLYSQWYETEPASNAILNQAIYGLAEAGHREAIKTSQLIANPGCYPTACLLAALPVLKAGLIEPDSIIFDAKSGLSGAGRSLSLGTHFCEIANNMVPYKLAGAHRHIPEIEQELSRIHTKPITVQFTPQLIPIPRGLLVTAYFKLKSPSSNLEIEKLYQEAYTQEPFIRLRTGKQVPELKQVQGSNFCDIGVYVDERTQRIIAVSAIDNLIKGAAGQAVQNMNLMYGLTETTGLLQASIYP